MICRESYNEQPANISISQKVVKASPDEGRVHGFGTDSLVLEWSGIRLEGEARRDDMERGEEIGGFVVDVDY